MSGRRGRGSEIAETGGYRRPSTTSICIGRRYVLDGLRLTDISMRVIRSYESLRIAY
jgi:hypothetical protein